MRLVRITKKYTLPDDIIDSKQVVIFNSKMKKWRKKVMNCVINYIQDFRSY